MSREFTYVCMQACALSTNYKTLFTNPLIYSVMQYINTSEDFMALI